MSAKSIVLVGHCGPDMMMLKTAMARIAGDVPVTVANDAAALAPVSGAGHVLLVNRVLDGGFESSSGIELIQRLAAGDDAPTMMLISNYADAQAEAEQAGALPGFGKSGLYDQTTAERVSAALDRAGEDG